MKKQLKPLPNDERLMYHGTPENPDIKIFVSHRIDLDSETIDNPLYIPVRCGAVYDERENITMLGDDTGENISEKRMSFCELTVLYWAWKNVKADYYGLCHYRRYLSFAEKNFEKVDGLNILTEPCLDKNFKQKHNLIKNFMEEVVTKYDLLCSYPAQLQGMSVYESFEKRPDTWPIEVVNKFITLFGSIYPEYHEAVYRYFHGKFWRGFNCFIMKNNLFQDYCYKLFKVLFALEESVQLDLYNKYQYRIIGYLGEAFTAIYIENLLKTKSIKHKELQLLKIENVELKKYPEPAFLKKNIPIVIASSNDYAPFLAVLIKSIEMNSSDNWNYDFIVLENHITDENKKIIRKILENKSNFSVRFLDASFFILNRKLHTAMHVTVNTYLRLVVLEIMKSYNKIIYLDCDTVVNTDLSEIYKVNLENKFIAAVQDSVMKAFITTIEKDRVYNEKELGVSEENPYFNAGVLVMNLEEIRKFYNTNNLLEIAESNDWRWFDQDVLNKISKNRTVMLSAKWNVMVHPYQEERELIESFAPVPFYEDYKEALKSPAIVHYAGRFIPCYCPNVPCADIFWKYAKQTPFYEYILSFMISLQKTIVLEPSFLKCVKLIIKKILFHLPFGKKIWNGMRKIFKRH